MAFLRLELSLEVCTVPGLHWNLLESNSEFTSVGFCSTSLYILQLQMNTLLGFHLAISYLLLKPECSKVVIEYLDRGWLNTV